jgi:dolichol-phosphate mannosyltransferase
MVRSVQGDPLRASPAPPDGVGAARGLGYACRSGAPPNMMQTVSIVIPAYNERETLPALVDRLVATIDGSNDGVTFEVLFVDDGSDDGSEEALDDLCRRDPRFRVIHLSRNFGHQAALQAGLDSATGDAVVLMDADLQDPPEMLADFIREWRRGSEVVYGVRRTRVAAAWKRAAYSVFYRSLRAISSETDIAPNVGDFCLMDRSVVEAMAALRERNRFLRGLRSWVGFRQMGIEYDRGPRAAGEAKYTLRKLVALAVSGYVGFSVMPLRIATWLGVVSATVGVGVGVWVIWTKFFGVYSPQGWASTMAMVLFAGGVQLLVLGVIGEYVGRIYEEVRARPLYVVRSRVGKEP